VTVAGDEVAVVILQPYVSSKVLTESAIGVSMM
jgi:hypothetical protein